MAETAEQIEATSRANLSRKSEDIFRRLWASLFYSGRAGGSVVICSPGMGEGASTVACGLALAGSEPTEVARVALVDFNIRRPAIHEILRLAPSPGIAEIITDKLDPASVAQRINPGLDVFTAGQVDRISALDILRGDGAATLIRSLGEKYDYVLIDTAAANHFPDAQILAAVAKDVVVVVRAEHTPREAAAVANKRLCAAGASVVGMVLNMRTYPIPQFLYRRM